MMKQKIISKIAKTKWMSNDETKSESIEKIDKLHGSLLGSNIFFNYTFLQQRYNGVYKQQFKLIQGNSDFRSLKTENKNLYHTSFQVTMGKDYFSNVMTMFAHFRQNLYHFINAPVDRTTYTWNLISFPFTVNAFHLQQLNSIGKI